MAFILFILAQGPPPSLPHFRTEVRPKMGEVPKAEGVGLNAQSDSTHLAQARGTAPAKKMDSSKDLTGFRDNSTDNGFSPRDRYGNQ